jgi:hypothetical protein
VSASACASPTSSEALVDYWAGAAPVSEAEHLEEHLFACDACSRRLAQVAEIARGVAQIAERRGGAHLMLTPSLVDRLAIAGVKMRHYDAAPGQRVECTVAADDDLLVTHLEANMRDIERVDVAVLDDAGGTIMRMQDVPVDLERRRICYTISGDVARTLPTVTIHVKVLAMETSTERTIAEYTFAHTRMRT